MFIGQDTKLSQRRAAEQGGSPAHKVCVGVYWSRRVIRNPDGGTALRPRRINGAKPNSHRNGTRLAKTPASGGLPRHLAASTYRGGYFLFQFIAS